MRNIAFKTLAILSLGACVVTPGKANANMFNVLQTGFVSKMGADRSYMMVSTSEEAPVGESKAFIEDLAESALSFLGNPEKSKAEKTAEFKTLLENAFDLKTIARFALGRNWRQATDEQKEEYMDLFQKMVLDVYSERFKEYQGQTLEVYGAQPKGSKDVVVKSHIVSPKGEKFAVDWRVRTKDSQHKIVDVIVEGVSMSLTQRSEFSSIVQRGGGNIEVLLDHLRKRHQ